MEKAKGFPVLSVQMHWLVLKNHRECYKDSMNKANIKRSKQRYENMLALGNLMNIINNHVVEKDERLEEDTVEKKNVEFQAAIFEKDRCVIAMSR